MGGFRQAVRRLRMLMRNKAGRYEMIRLDMPRLLMLTNVRLNNPWNMFFVEINEEMEFLLECLSGEMERPHYL
jgi:hypothetical protein